MVYIIGGMVALAVVCLGYSIFYDCSDKGKKAKVYNDLQDAKKKAREIN